MGRVGLEPTTMGLKVAADRIGTTHQDTETAYFYRRFVRSRQACLRANPLADVPTLFPPPSLSQTSWAKSEKGQPAGEDAIRAALATATR